MREPVTQYLNFLSINLLEKLGNDKPMQKQIDILESILGNITTNQQLLYDHKLTRREIGCLYWAAMGKTSKETAELLNVRPYTVEEYRKTIKKKLICKSMAEAVFKGMRFGYINDKSKE